MNRQHFSQSLAVVAVSVLGAVTFAGPRSARADVVVDVPAPEFLATVQPVYYENHASYYWHNRWYWREGTAWRHYDTEPAFLMDRRMHDPPGRWFYGHHDAHGGGYWGHDLHGGHGGHEEPHGGGHEEHGGAHGGGHEHK